MAKRRSTFGANTLELDFTTTERAALEQLAFERKMTPAQLARAYIKSGMAADLAVSQTNPEPDGTHALPNDRVQRMFQRQAL